MVYSTKSRCYRALLGISTQMLQALSNRAHATALNLKCYKAFRVDSVDVFTNASVTAKIVACGMYMCILPQLTRKHVRIMLTR